MKRTSTLLVTAVVGVSMTLTACGSNSDTQSAQGEGGAGKVGVILPDTKSSVRWETKDRPALEAAFKNAGVEYTIQNAEGSADTRVGESHITGARQWTDCAPRGGHRPGHAHRRCRSGRAAGRGVP